MNIILSTTAEALIQELLELGHNTPENIIENALQYFYSQQTIDTTSCFPELTETAILVDNEERWQSFQDNPQEIPHEQVEAWLKSRNQAL